VRALSARRDVLAISLIICATDVVYGMVAPTFSLFVEDLGGSALVVGVLAAAVGVTRLLAALPVGSLSDRFGPKLVLVIGLLLFGGSCSLFTVSAEPLLLLVPRVLFGLAIVATFPLGIAYIGDFVRRDRRTLAISIYVSAQGVGYAIGPVIGSLLAEELGYATTFRIAAVLALCTAAAAGVVLRRRPEGSVDVPPAGASRQGVTNALAGACLANLVMMLMFSGTVLPYLSLYAADIGMSVVAVGAVYAARATASVVARLVVGGVARRLSNAQVVLLALSIDALAALAIGANQLPALVAVAAVADGVAFGLFLAASQSLVADEASDGTRRAAMGLYGVAGAAGETMGALLLGVVAVALGMRAVFVVAGVVLLAAIPVVSHFLRSAAAGRTEASALALRSEP
jgi:MFS family permease